MLGFGHHLLHALSGLGRVLGTWEGLMDIEDTVAALQLLPSIEEVK
jgi:hypothetical protein